MIPYPLISPKPFSAYEPDEYREYVRGMFEMPRPKRGAKPAGPAPGLTVRRTAKGALSITRRAKTRPFAYITMGELVAVAAAAKCSQAELWNVLKAKDFIVSKTRMEAEMIYGELKGIPF